jgi:antitoxin ParD1/3/4
LPRNTSVTLGKHFEAFVNEKIDEGRFQSVSEAVRAGLRRLEEDELKLEALRSKLAAGETGALVEDFSPADFLAGMREKHGR